MIQVRTKGSQEPLGTFHISTDDSKTKTLTCSENAVSHSFTNMTTGFQINLFVQDSVSHANPSLVQDVTIQWSATTLPADVVEIAF